MSKLLKANEITPGMVNKITSFVKDLKVKGVCPKICTILVEGDPASEYYAKAKERLAKKLGIDFDLIKYSQTVTEKEISDKIDSLNKDIKVHGIMVELPLPKQINSEKIKSIISPLKDVDGVTSANRLACFTGETGIYPATPQSCLKILKSNNVPLKGKNVVLLGRGETVGQPLIHMLLRENATLTICHSYTGNFSEHIKNADILITAVGKVGLVTAEMVHENLVVVDAGINEIDDGIVGDVSSEVKDVVRAITPVPGGIGSLTTAILFENLLKAMELQGVVIK